MTQEQNELLWTSLTDMIRETHIKVGYTASACGINYLRSSLCAMLRLTDDALEPALAEFFAAYSDRLGTPEITHHGDILHIRIPKEGAAYVHDNLPENDFLKALVGLLKAQDGALTEEAILALFRTYAPDVRTVHPANAEELGADLVIWFADGKPDPYCYCMENEMGFWSYHRFGAWDLDPETLA